MNDPKKDQDIDLETGVKTTGHESDGIKELNNPLPRWWLWTFYLCITLARWPMTRAVVRLGFFKMTVK